MTELAFPLVHAGVPTTIRLSARAGAAVEVRDGTLWFDVGADAIYASTAGGRVTAAPPPDRRLALTPSSTYRLTLDVACEGEVVLWILELAGTTKLAQHTRKLAGPQIVLTWNTDPRHEQALIALRLRGAGHVRIDRAVLQELAPELPADAPTPTSAPRRLVTDPAPPYLRPIVSIDRVDDDTFTAISPLDLDPRFDRDREFAVLQLELLWQLGLIDAVDLTAAPAIAPRLAAWIERRQIPTLPAPDPTAQAALVDHRRAHALAHPERLAFPRVPETAEDCRAQGFVVVPPEEFASTEFQGAKEFWKDYGVRSWYQADKPWTGWLARWVEAMRPKRVLEFGCNVGRNLAGIRDLCPGVELVGLDINAEAIAAGREHTGLDLRVADEGSLAGFDDGAFDAVFTVSVLDHMSDIGPVCRELLRVASRHAVFFEVRLPLEGRVDEHFDHKAGQVRPSTGASYSWHVERYLSDPRLTALSILPTYLHAASLGPYYAAYFASLGAA